MECISCCTTSSYKEYHSVRDEYCISINQFTQCPYITAKNIVLYCFLFLISKCYIHIICYSYVCHLYTCVLSHLQQLSLTNYIYLHLSIYMLYMANECKIAQNDPRIWVSESRSKSSGRSGRKTHINIHIDRYIDYVCRYEMFVSTILFFICCLFQFSFFSKQENIIF